MMLDPDSQHSFLRVNLAFLGVSFASQKGSLTIIFWESKELNFECKKNYSQTNFSVKLQDSFL